MLAGELHETALLGMTCVVDLDSRADIVIRDRLSCDLFQFFANVRILADRKCKAVQIETVLRMSEENDGHLVAHGDTDILAHGAERITDSGCDHAVKAVHRAVQQHLDSELRDRAVECRAVLFRSADGLLIGSPHAEGDHSRRVNKFFRCIVGKDADSLFPLCLIGAQLSSGRLRNLIKFLE